MCGIVGIVSHSPVNQMLYDALLLLQHRYVIITLQQQTNLQVIRRAGPTPFS
jgi:glutamine phosphoribosylpyrophosphate amidotransferase